MTLTQTAILVKRLITISIIVLVVGIVSFTSYRIWYAYYLANLPPVEEKPDTKFGSLPSPDFPKAFVSTSNFSYSLDTTTGGLPKVGVDPGFEKIIKVYFLTQTFATLLSPDRSAVLAEKFGLTLPPVILSDTKYQFKNQNKTLTVNLDNGNFSYTNSASPSAAINPDDDQKIVADFQQVLANLGVLKEDLRVGRNRVVLLKEPPAVQVSLWPAAIDKRLVLTGDFNESLVSATISGNANNLDNYLSLNFTYFPIDTSTFATYPLKSAEQAFNDLKNGQGVVIIEPDKPQVSITAISLGYYLSENYSPYLQPIYVFEGSNFVAYVPAINEQFQTQAN